MISVSSGYMVGGPGTTIEIDESMFGKHALLSLFYILLPLVSLLRFLMVMDVTYTSVTFPFIIGK